MEYPDADWLDQALAACQSERDEWRDLARRLGAVATAAEDYRMSNDVSDELHDALDKLYHDDLARATADGAADGDADG